MLSDEQRRNSFMSILRKPLLFSELRWNFSEFLKDLWSLRAHFVSELQWNSHFPNNGMVVRSPDGWL